RALRAELLARAAGFAPETAHEVGEAPSRELLRVPPGVLAVSLVLTGATWGWLVAGLVVVPLLWMATHSLWTVLAAALPLFGAAGSTTGRWASRRTRCGATTACWTGRTRRCRRGGCRPCGSSSRCCGGGADGCGWNWTSPGPTTRCCCRSPRARSPRR